MARWSPIPSAGLEVKLLLHFSGPAAVVSKMKLLIRQSYNWDYDGAVSASASGQPLDSDDESDSLVLIPKMNIINIVILNFHNKTMRITL